MTINYHHLKSWKVPPVIQKVEARDAILYALGVGMGYDPDDPGQLQFVYEKSLRMLPTFSAVLAYPGVWLADPGTGVSWKHCLNGEYAVTYHNAPRLGGSVRGQVQIEDIIDKGRDFGALIYTRREVTDEATGELLCVIHQTIVSRADGGFGGPTGPVKKPHTVPTRAPDLTCDTHVSNQAALIYRLSGDPNPLHADPDVAREAGYDRPILHGGATYGIAGGVILKLLCNYEPERFKRFDTRFSAPVYPGDFIQTEIWKLAPGQVAFRARVPARNVTVLNNGYAQYAE